jgi:hypothetical protein
VRTHGRRRREFPELFRRPEYGQAAVVPLPTPAAAEAFLAEATSASIAPSSPSRP